MTFARRRFGDLPSRVISSVEARASIRNSCMAGGPLTSWQVATPRIFRRIHPTRHVGLAEGSASDTAGETALPVILFPCLHLGLSGWRSLSPKTRVNLA